MITVYHDCTITKHTWVHHVIITHIISQSHKKYRGCFRHVMIFTHDNTMYNIQYTIMCSCYDYLWHTCENMMLHFMSYFVIWCHFGSFFGLKNHQKWKHLRDTLWLYHLAEHNDKNQTDSSWTLFSEKCHSYSQIRDEIDPPKGSLERKKCDMKAALWTDFLSVTWPFPV